MKKRNTTIFAFLLLAAVGMGVGYAALTQDMDVIGNVTLSKGQAQEEFKQEVKFVKGNEAMTYKDAKGQTKAPVTGDGVTYDADYHVATWTINTLAAKDETGVITLTVKNESDVAAKVSAIDAQISNDGATYFTVSHDLALNTRIEVGAQITFNVTVEMINDYTKEEAGSFEFSFGFTVTSDEI